MTLNLANLSVDARSALLLDFVKGRTTDEQAAEIRLAARSDKAIAEEIAYYEGLANALHKPETHDITDALGWARLSQAIESEARPIAANDNTRWWKYAAAAFAVIAAFQAALLVQSRPDVDEPIYVAASDATAQTFSLAVAFQSDATLDEITALLRDLDGNITDGPSALGLYIISFSSDASRDQAMTALQEADAIIENVSLR